MGAGWGAVCLWGWAARPARGAAAPASLSYGGSPSNVRRPALPHAARRQVCVVALKKGQLQVLSNAWDRDLGGRDLDRVLFDHFAK